MILAIYSTSSTSPLPLPTHNPPLHQPIPSHPPILRVPLLSTTCTPPSPCHIFFPFRPPIRPPAARKRLLCPIKPATKSMWQCSRVGHPYHARTGLPTNPCRARHEQAQQTHLSLKGARVVHTNSTHLNPKRSVKCTHSPCNAMQCHHHPHRFWARAASPSPSPITIPIPYIHIHTCPMSPSSPFSCAPSHSVRPVSTMHDSVPKRALDRSSPRPWRARRERWTPRYSLVTLRCAAGESRLERGILCTPSCLRCRLWTGCDEAACSEAGAGAWSELLSYATVFDRSWMRGSVGLVELNRCTTERRAVHWCVGSAGLREVGVCHFSSFDACKEMMEIAL
ncbi:hypothetical protein DE146DRAFT_661196 [Phaeosphaeria sp. MPI-PUGE-AT-0046c]|nr:hypothetical protein DE146DRAFT_661196 [Phaeosphaeria sp. MPI-PUGE-AT-0046c]